MHNQLNIGKEPFKPEDFPKTKSLSGGGRRSDVSSINEAITEVGLQSARRHLNTVNMPIDDEILMSHYTHPITNKRKPKRLSGE